MGKFNRGHKNTDDEKGAIVIIVALLMTAFIAFLAIVVDIGYMFEARRQLQSAADAAALVGMTDKLDGKDNSQILTAMTDYANKNDFKNESSLEISDTEITDSYVKLTVSKKVKTFFAPIFSLFNGGSNYNENNISAQAKAKRVYLVGIRGAMPWGVSVVRIKKATASIYGSAPKKPKEVLLDTQNLNDSSGSWEGVLKNIPEGNGNYRLELNVVNGQDYAMPPYSFQIMINSDIATLNSSEEIPFIDKLELVKVSDGWRISLRVKDLEYGKLYELKIVSDPESGNFNALDLGGSYYDNIEFGYKGNINIGDTIFTLPGNKSGPQTDDALTNRFGDDEYSSFAEWESANKPQGCPRLVTVPVIELTEELNGKKPAVVVALGNFFIDDFVPGGGKQTIKGRFVEYAKAGTWQDDLPDSEIYTLGVRLDKTDY